MNYFTAIFMDSRPILAITTVRGVEAKDTLPFMTKDLPSAFPLRE